MIISKDEENQNLNNSYSIYNKKLESQPKTLVDHNESLKGEFLDILGSHSVNRLNIDKEHQGKV